jgi:hypothetical protein
MATIEMMRLRDVAREVVRRVAEHARLEAYTGRRVLSSAHALTAPLPAALVYRGKLRALHRARPRQAGIGVCLLRERVQPSIERKAAHARRGAADCCQHRQAARATS